jgi:hypothetical protein
MRKRDEQALAIFTATEILAARDNATYLTSSDEISRYRLFVSATYGLLIGVGVLGPGIAIR